MVFNYEQFLMLNESFKSKIISNLFKSGEFGNISDKDKALFNQVTDDDIIGIADSKEEAKKLLHDTMGDMPEDRYDIVRRWYNVGPDDCDYDLESVFDRTVNRTVEEYYSWMQKLESGKYLVMRIEKNEMEDRLRKIKDPRWFRDHRGTDIPLTKYKNKFLARKRFVETHKEDIRKYKEFIRILEEKGLLDEFLDAANACLNEYQNGMDWDDIAYEIYDNGRDTELEIDELEVEVGDYKIVFWINAEILYKDIIYESDPGDYWTPPYADIEIVDPRLSINEMTIYVDNTKTEEEFEFSYLPEFDRDHVINFE